MAKCPNCNRTLHFWNFKAECPDCGISIPNHEWEKRLEEDAYKREEAYFKMHTTTKRISFAAVGTPMRIARLVLSFLPIIGYVVPLASFIFESENSEPLVIKNASVITLFTSKTFKLGDIFSLLSSADTKQAGILAVASLGVLALSLLLGIIAFFLVPLANKKPRTPVHAILHCLSIVSYALTPVVLAKFIASYCVYDVITASLEFGIYIGIALFVLAFIADIIVIATPVGEKDYKYIPTDDLQREYGISAGIIAEDEFPPEKKTKTKKEE